MSLISKFTKAASKTPLEKIANRVVNDLENKLENSVNDFFSKALSKTGISSSVSSILSARFGDSLQNDLSDKYFRTSTAEQNRLTCDEIRGGITPRYAETTSESIARLDNVIDTGLDTYQFPDQIGKYYIHMKFREYVRTTPQAKANLNFKNSIILPIPRKLEERFQLDVNDKATGIVGAGADILQGSFSEGGSGNPIGDVASNAAALNYSLASTMIPGDIAGVIGSYLGSVPNPNMATFFSGINMRSHAFEWTFSPRNKKESYELMKVIERLKQNSLPAFSPVGNAILQYPYLCFIEMHPWAKDKGNELIKFKPCLLKNMSYNYAPNGIPSFFEGTNLPTFISISLDFIETEYFTSNDYGRSGRTDDKITQSVDYIKDVVGDAGSDLLNTVTTIFGANTSG